MEELLGFIPELFDFASEFVPLKNNLIQIDLELDKNISDNWTRLLVLKKEGHNDLTSESLVAKYPEITKDETKFETEDAIGFEKSCHKNVLECWDMVPKCLYQSVSNELFLLSATDPVSELDAQLAIMYIFAHIVRYKPPLWQEILKTIYEPLIEKFVGISEEKFPRLILTELLKEIFIFE